MATTKKYVSLEKLGLYNEKIKKVISDNDTATLDAAKEYADSLATNYEAAGSVASAKEELQGKIDDVQANVDVAQAAADNAQGEVDALETLIGTLPDNSDATSLVDFVTKRTEGIASDEALSGVQDAVDAVESDVAAIKTDYLTSADKQVLQDSIAAEATTAREAEKANADAIKAISNDYLKQADKTELQGNIDTNTEAIAAIKEDVDTFFKDADMTEQAKDTLKEIQEYINSDATAAAEMTASIKQNADAITALDAKVGTIPTDGVTATDVVDYVNEVVNAEKNRAETAEADLDSRLDAIESKFSDSGEGSVSDQIANAKDEAIEAAKADATTKAEAALADAKTYADTKDDEIKARVDDLEAVTHTHDNKDVIDGITTNKVTAWDDAATKAHTHDNATELDKIADGDVAKWNAAEQNAKDYADGLNTAMDTRVTTVESWQTNMVEVSEEEINALFA